MKEYGIEDDMIVRCEGISKYYPSPLSISSILKLKFKRRRKLVLDDIEFSVRRGEIFGIIGPNGAGKTTTVKILCNLTTPTLGSASVCGYDVQKDSREVIKRIGYCLSEERSFFWRLTGRQNLEFFSDLMEVSPETAATRIEELVDLFNLADAIDERFLSYSSGMKQKMAIVRSLLSDPDVIFMDEPTRGLDPGASLKLRNLITGYVNESGKTVVITTNRVGDIEALCQRVMVLNKGRMIASGSIEEIRSSVISEVGEKCSFEEIFNRLIDRVNPEREIGNG